jgi:riboflavin synthase
MFTGIIETIGTCLKIEVIGTNKIFWIQSAISEALKVDQSLAHNGVCLTVESVEGNFHKVTAIEETLKKSNLGLCKEGDIVNLERCMLMNGRIDGHIVQGHVDSTAICIDKKQLEGSWEFTFQFEEAFAHLIIEKGSVCVNGISLTCFNVTRNNFTVAIIPYTFEHTNIKQVQMGTVVNIEFDIIGKYISRMNELANS